MPLSARDVREAPPPRPPAVTIDTSVYDEVDRLLRPDWMEHELVDGASDHELAGRFHDVTGLIHAQRVKLAEDYRQAGWTVYLGNVEGGRCLAQFIPTRLAERALKRRAGVPS